MFNKKQEIAELSKRLDDTLDQAAEIAQERNKFRERLRNAEAAIEIRDSEIDKLQADAAVVDLNRQLGAFSFEALSRSAGLEVTR